MPLAEVASSLALRRDGSVLAVGDRAGTVTLLDTDTPDRYVERIKPSSGEAESLLPLALAFSPDGTAHLAVGSRNRGRSRFWSILAQPNQGLGFHLHLPGHRGTRHLLGLRPRGPPPEPAATNDRPPGRDLGPRAHPARLLRLGLARLRMKDSNTSSLA